MIDIGSRFTEGKKMSKTGAVLVRAGKVPFLSTSVVETLEKNHTLTNTGNLLFQHAFIRHIYQPNLKIFAIQDGPYSDQDIQKINANFDAVFLTFANAFRPTFRGALKSWASAIKKIKVPVVIIGIGAQCETEYAIQELKSINDDVKELCEVVLEKSKSIGVRGDFTANYLNDLGVKSVDVIGCPSMFYFGAELPKPKPVDFNNPKLIAFHFSPQSPANFGASNAHVEAQLNAMLQFMLAQANAGCTYVAQDTQELRQRIWGIKGVTLSRYAPELADIATIYPVDPHMWIQDLRQFDMAFGTRIHGAIAAILAGIPSIIFCHDSRTTELANYFGLPQIDITKILNKPLSAEELSVAMDKSTMHNCFSDRYQKYINFLVKNNVPCALNQKTGINSYWDQYETEIQSAKLPPTLDSNPDNPELTNQKLNRLHEMIRQKLK